MPKVKICGNTNLGDAEFAVQAGVDFLGFIFSKKSKRTIAPQDARNIIREIPQFSNWVGVFMNQPKDEVEEIARALNLKWLQFHGEETSRYCEHFMAKGFQVIKTFHVKDELSLKRLDEYSVSAFLFDTYSTKEKGGSGRTFDWNLIQDKPYVHGRLFLAGGLNVENVRQAIETVHPYALDVASGVEKSPGIKDRNLIQSFIQAAKEPHAGAFRRAA